MWDFFIHEGWLLILVGSGAGILAGLFGLGGGVLVVPGLLFVFWLLKFPTAVLMHLAIGTSLSIMICTATSSVWAHQRNGNILWPVTGRVLPGIICGVVAGTLLANRMNGRWLEILFGVFVLILSMKMFTGFRGQRTHRNMPGRGAMFSFGTAVGLKSGLLGVGGGILSVPFLTYCGLPMKKAAGTSASFSWPISIMGTISFIIVSHGKLSIPGATGYVYWPAFICVAPFAALCAPIGAGIHNRVGESSDRILQRVFAVLLFLVGVKMFTGNLQFLK